MRATAKRFLLSTIGRIFIAIMVLLLAAGIYVKFINKSILSPGPVSAAQHQNEPLNGFASHADFERDCGHCHAPIHCVTDTRCQDCHLEVAQQRATAQGLHGRLPGTNQCQTCHIEHKGREAVISKVSFVNIDHERLTSFSLEKHYTDFNSAPLTCDSCHTQHRFEAAAVDCVSCHAIADHDFTSTHIVDYGANCFECHDGKDRMSDFDHNEIFVWDGAHAEAACIDCHTEQTYVGTSAECGSCHEKTGNTAQMFGSDCGRCHTADGWIPAQLTYHTFDLEHGGNGQIDCETCHVETYAEHSCYGCHDDHNPAQTLAQHPELSIEEVEECATCHPTGQPGEAEFLAQNQSN